MYIETNRDALQCDIWIDRDHSFNYRENKKYKEVVASFKAAGYSICVYVGGELPLLPLIDEMLTPNPISA